MCLTPKSSLKTGPKVKLPQCKVVLRNILKCTVKLQRLSNEQIEKAGQGKWQPTENKRIHKHQDHSYSKNIHDDHNYSKASIPSKSPKADDVLSFLAQQETKQPEKIINSLYSGFDPSSDSDSYDDDETDGYSVVNGKAVAYPIQDTDTDSDTDDNVEVTQNTVIKIEVGAHDEQDSGISNGYHYDESEHTNGMDMGRSPSSSPSLNDDEDDDMRFLNGIAEQLEQSDDEVVANCDENGEIWPSNRIFGDICLKYLRDTCYGTFCDFSHELPVQQTVEARLRSASRHEIEEVQNEILLKHDVLMDEYFPLFCKFYGRQWQTHRESLRRLISVLSTRPAAALYMKEIFGGFLISGMEYSTCVDQLLNEFDDSLNSEERFELIWELMIDPRNDQIDEQLKEFKHLWRSDAIIAATALNRMLEHQINGDLESLRDTTVALVKSTTVATFRKLDATLLKQYIQLLRTLNLNDGKLIQNRAKQFGVVIDC